MLKWLGEKAKRRPETKRGFHMVAVGISQTLQSHGGAFAAHLLLGLFAGRGQQCAVERAPSSKEDTVAAESFGLPEQSVMLKTEKLVLTSAEQNLLGSVGKNLALALLCSRSLGISRHVAAQITSLSASPIPWTCACLRLMA